MNVDKGYVEAPIPEGIDLKKEIERLKKEKRAVVMAHYYQKDEIQDVADYIGDSLALARIAKDVDADIIVLCGVHFMGETAKILCPSKKVIVPDVNAGCSLADSCNAAEFKKFIESHPGHTVISYVNTTAEVKALTDVVVTSGNAKEIVESFPHDEKIIFGPDRNLLVHPECKKALQLVADKIGSTAVLLKYACESDCDTFIVATESGILHEMRKRCPEKRFIAAPPDDSTCACNECSYMKLNTLEKLYNSLKYELPCVEVEAGLIEKARRPIEKMLELSKKITESK